VKLCSFEVSTAVGRYQRLGAVTDAGIVDLNFAYAACLKSHGERRPQVVANALLPANMLAFLEAGAQPRAEQAVEDIVRFERGPNDETLLYRAEEVRLLTPLPNPRSLRDFYAFEAHVKRGFEKRGEAMPEEWYQMPVYYKSGPSHAAGLYPKRPVGGRVSWTWKVGTRTTPGRWPIRVSCGSAGSFRTSFRTTY